MESFENKIKKQINQFINKGFFLIGKEEKKTIKFYLRRIIGSRNDNLIILKKNEGFVGIDKDGNLVGIDNDIIYICGWG